MPGEGRGGEDVGGAEAEGKTKRRPEWPRRGGQRTRMTGTPNLRVTPEPGMKPAAREARSGVLALLGDTSDPCTGPRAADAKSERACTSGPRTNGPAAQPALTRPRPRRPGAFATFRRTPSHAGPSGPPRHPAVSPRSRDDRPRRRPRATRAPSSRRGPPNGARTSARARPAPVVRSVRPANRLLRLPEPAAQAFRARLARAH